MRIALLASEADHAVFQDAVHAFAKDGDRARFMRQMLALGVTADAIRWHVRNRGTAAAAF